MMILPLLTGMWAGLVFGLLAAAWHLPLWVAAPDAVLFLAIWYGVEVLL